MRWNSWLLVLALSLVINPAWANTWEPTGPAVKASKFRRTRSKLNAKLGSARHSAVDVMTSRGRSARVAGKFIYGKVSKDLEHEDVSLWLLGGKRWRRIQTERTNDDGRATFRVPGTHLKKEGPHPFALVVHGDGTRAYGTIWVVQRGTKAVIFDIDGTLTTGDDEIIDNAVTGDPVEMRAGGAALAKHWAGRGLLPVYLTGRPYMFNPSTRKWLSKHGFPPGPLATTKFVGQARPTSGGVGSFKQSWIKRIIQDSGLAIIAAYGNAKTDICAFAQAGIAPESTFIVGKNGGKRCKGHKPTRPITDFGSHLRELTGPAR